MLTPQEQEFFSQLIYTHSGIALGPDKTYLFENRLGEVAKILGLKSLAELHQRAKTNLTNDLRDMIVEAMTTNETLFFRDKSPFEAMRLTIIPEIMKRKSATKVLRIWSAACSTGQEAYSVAMMLNESFPEIMSTWRVEIFGTDISTQVVSKAIEGKYSQIEVNRGLPITHLIKYFRQEGSEWIVSDNLKKICKFKKMNLKENLTALGSFDIILCRYVLIYFDLQGKQKIFRDFNKLLGTEGYLFLGSSETVFGITDDFVRNTTNNAIFYKVRES